MHAEIFLIRCGSRIFSRGEGGSTSPPPMKENFTEHNFHIQQNAQKLKPPFLLYKGWGIQCLFFIFSLPPDLIMNILGTYSFPLEKDTNLSLANVGQTKSKWTCTCTIYAIKHNLHSKHKWLWSLHDQTYLDEFYSH